MRHTLFKQVKMGIVEMAEVVGAVAIANLPNPTSVPNAEPNAIVITHIANPLASEVSSSFPIF
jgi:hypothetical protein